jgi:L-seryl-tRNA(Ser) seleniumtransferase
VRQPEVALRRGAEAEGVYGRLGVRRLVNAAGFHTIRGGSLMPAEVVAAMVEAARSYVRIDDLLARAGERIAALTRNEAGFVTSGAGAGLLLATAACVAGKDPAKQRQLPDVTGLKGEVVVFRQHRNSHDHAVRQTGVRLREIGYDQRATAAWELDAAIGAETAAIVYFLNVFTPQPHAYPGHEGPLPLGEVIAIARRRGVPVIVDAAHNLPPVDRLWQYTRMGADLVVFSGGKELRGPQCTGLILGRTDLIEACAMQANPMAGIGRVAKVGKEEIAGLVAAVERYVALDHEAEARRREDVVAYLVDELGRLPHLATARVFPAHDMWEVPEARITFQADGRGIGRDEVASRLAAGDPAAEGYPSGANGLLLCPATLEAGDAEVVVRRITEIVAE